MTKKKTPKWSPWSHFVDQSVSGFGKPLTAGSRELASAVVYVTLNEVRQELLRDLDPVRVIELLEETCSELEHQLGDTKWKTLVQ